MRLVYAAGFSLFALVSGWTGHTLGTKSAPDRTAFLPETLESDMMRYRDSVLAEYASQGDKASPRLIGEVGGAVAFGVWDIRGTFDADEKRYLVAPDTVRGIALLERAEALGDTSASHGLWILRQRTSPSRSTLHARTAARRGARWGAKYAVADDLRAERYDSLAALLAHPVAGPNVRAEAEAMRRITDSVAVAASDTTARRMADALGQMLGR